LSNENDDIPQITIYDAIHFVARAWDTVTQRTICHSWQRSGILPLHQLSDDEEQGGDSNDCDEKQQLENDLTDLIIQLPISEPLSAGEYIRFDDNEEYGDEASIKDIVDVVRGVGAVDESDTELKKEVSTSNALECITTLIDFINQNNYEVTLVAYTI